MTKTVEEDAVGTDAEEEGCVEAGGDEGGLE